VIWDVALPILALGHGVILDWNGWSRARRTTWRDHATHAGYRVILHYIYAGCATASVARCSPGNVRQRSSIATAARR